MNLIYTAMLFLQFVNPYETRVFVNFEAEFIVYARYYQGNLIGIDSIVPMPQYLTDRLRSRNEKLMLEELKRDWLKQGGGGYGSQGLIGTFEIPLPKGGFSDFMGETGKLDVGGYVKITLGGSKTIFNNTNTDLSQNDTWLPELTMKQEMAINLDGQVGDRVKVFIDHNSERLDESQNKITITYKGREDEILQEIEGGDTQLSIPATTYTGDVPSHRGLFGIKSMAKLGPLDIVGIASKEQTEAQELVIEGTVRADTGRIQSKDYEKRRFFWIGTYDSIITGSLQVYVDDNNGQNNFDNLTWEGAAYVDIDDDNIPDSDTIPGWFTLQLPGDFYQFVPGSNVLRLNSSLDLDYDMLAVSYQKMVNGQLDTIGEPPESLHDRVHLKLICPQRPDTSSYTWRYEKRNYYQIVSPGSRLDSLRIYYKPTGGDATFTDSLGRSLIEVLRLDTLPRDGMVDEFRVYDPNQGLLIFPDSMPFASSALPVPDSEIYSNPYNYVGDSKYYMYKKTIEAKPVYELPSNTEKVTVWVDEVLQDSLTDYHVDKEGGRLEFKKVIPPTARVRIKVEYSPMFSMAQKSLVGMRASMKTLGDGSLGASFFYRTESYLAEHPRLREEPFNRMVLETDFALPESLPFLTKLVDWLPLISTETQSRLNLNFEGAFSFSNLNSQGQVYLDDLESSTILSNEIQISRTSWAPGSKPLGRDTSGFVREKLVWYNPIDKERLTADDIYDTTPDPNDIADVLKIIYRPDSASSYAGLTQYVYGEDFSECEKFELIVKGHQGRLHVDVAQEISEDQLRRDRDGRLIGVDSLDDEDQVSPRGTWVEQTEDTGLDGVYGTDSLNVASDCRNDDYRASDYTGGINGTEGNRVWDTEDIDRNGIMNTVNKFYSFSVHLDSIKNLVEDSGLKPGWLMFRIPIKDSLAPDTFTTVRPDWRNIKYIRIWLDEFTQAETLLIYKINFTGSRWKNYGVRSDSGITDTSEHFTLTPVNTKNNPYYRSPYPLEKDMLGNYKTEGALELNLENIRRDHYGIAYRRTEQAEDYRGYDTLSFYFNAQSSNPEITLRMGADSLNFYEYSSLYKGSGELVLNNYRLYKIPLETFLTLKNHKRESGFPSGDTLSEGNYTVAGNPSLAANYFFEIRIKNPNDIPITDMIWFNDVKLTGPKREVGRIVRGNGSLNIADLSTINFSFNESNGRFKRLSEPKDISSLSSGRSYSVSGSLAMDKFLPADWHFSIPLGLSYNKNINEPRFWYNANDLEIAPEDFDVMRERSQTNSYTVQLSKSGSKNWFLKQTLDRLTLSHDRSNSVNRGALNCDSLQNMNFGGSYNLDPKMNLKILNQNISLLPTANFSASLSDNLARVRSRTDINDTFKLQDAVSQRHRTLNPSLSLNYTPHPVLTSNFQFAQNRDARDSYLRKNRFGEEVARNQSLNATFQKNLFMITPVLTYNAGYTEDHRLEIRQDQDYRNVSNTSRYGVNTGVDIKRMVKLLTGLRDEKKDSLQAPGSPLWIVKEIERFVEYIQNPTLIYARQRSSSYLQVLIRPDLKYQFGFIDTIPRDDFAPTSYPGRGVADNYGVNSGLNFKIISVQGGYTGQVSKNLLSSGQITRSVGQNYPNATLRLSRLEGLPLLKKYTYSSSLNFGFNQDFSKIFTDSVLQSDSRTVSFNPLTGWQTNWMKGISTTTEITYSETKSTQHLGASDVQSRSSTRGGLVSAGYSFSAPTGIKLPFLKNIKFASNLSFNLTLNYSRTTSYGEDLLLPTADNSTLSSNLGMSYNFSASITGGANFDYAENKDLNNLTASSKRVGLNIWANVNF